MEPSFTAAFKVSCSCIFFFAGFICVTNSATPNVKYQWDRSTEILNNERILFRKRRQEPGSTAKLSLPSENVNVTRITPTAIPAASQAVNYYSSPEIPLKALVENTVMNGPSSPPGSGNDKKPADRSSPSTFAAATSAEKDLFTKTKLSSAVKPAEVDAEASFPDESDCKPPNICSIKEDENIYYSVRYIADGRDYWIDPYSLGVPVNVHTHLANNHMMATRIRLSFEFIYYGHNLDALLATTGGFLYMNEYSHSFLTATQYIAPLMADFDTSLGNESLVLIADNGTVCIVQWNKVFLTKHQSYGEYTFQAQLYKSSGKIVFAYLEVPKPFSMISSEDHPVRVGIADAFYWDTHTIRSVHEYNLLTLKMDKITSHSAVVLDHKKSCQFLKTCKECATIKLPQFDCAWCSLRGRCSNAVDRMRQDWYQSGCDKDKIGGSAELCGQSRELNATGDILSHSGGISGPSVLNGLVVPVLSSIALFTSLTCVAWCCYAYRHPESYAGRWLIENRPVRLLQRLRQWKRANDNEDSCAIEIQALPSETSVILS